MLPGQYPRLHVTYTPAKFDIATSHGYKEDAFTRNTLFDLDLRVHYLIIDLDLGQGHTKCYPVPTTLCDLFSYKV